MYRVLLSALILVLLIPLNPSCAVDALIIMAIIAVGYFSKIGAAIIFFIAFLHRQLNVLGAFVLFGLAYLLTFFIPLPDD